MKIEVRKEVEISAYGAGPHTGDDMFLQTDRAFSKSISSSFDETLASAMHSHLDAQANSPVIPAFPNAYKSASWRDSIPIRSVAAGLSDGVNEGFGRIRREIGKVRSPQNRLRNTENLQALAFDEDAEEVFAEDELSSTKLGDGRGDLTVDQLDSHSGGSTSTGTNLDTLPDDVKGEDPVWDGAVHDAAEYDRAVAEDARFDDIGVAGFLMEEEEREKEREKIAMKTGKPKAKGKKGKKK